MPAPIQPSEAPYVSLSFEGVSPPKPMPMFGVNSQSARALAGPTTSISAAIRKYFFDITVPPGPAVHVVAPRDGSVFTRPERCKQGARDARCASGECSARERERGRMLREEVPRPACVGGRGAKMADGHADGKRAIHARM